MSWESWIMNQEGTSSHYDFLAELAVSSYNLKSKDRREKQKNLLHFFVLWWRDNQKRFIKYNSKSALSRLLDIHWATVIHYESKRKPSRLYEENIKCIKDFLNS